MNLSLLVYLFNTYLKLFFILTPFFVLSVFLAMTADYDEKARKILALRVGIASLITAFVIYFFGEYIFNIFGITLDSFRIGAGALLFLSSVSLSKGEKAQAVKDKEEADIAVVPLAIPVAIGPGTTGALLVMGGETSVPALKASGYLALVLAVFSLWLMLFLASRIEAFLGKRYIVILSKLTGIILAAIAAQMVFTGIKNIFFG